MHYILYIIHYISYSLTVLEQIYESQCAHEMVRRGGGGGGASAVLQFVVEGSRFMVFL